MDVRCRFAPLVMALVLVASAACRQAPQPEPSATPGAAGTEARAQGWQVIGPGGGGAQFEPTVSPHDPANVFVRCDMTGAYVTGDAGESWKMFNLRTVVRDFEWDPVDPQVAYACNSGLYRSADRGGSWELVYPAPEDVTGETMSGDHAGQRFITGDGMPDAQIDHVLVEPEDNRVLYLGLGGSRRGEGGGCRLLVSEDRGASWREAATVPGGGVEGIFPGSWEGVREAVVVVTDRAVARVSLEDGQVESLPLPGQRVLSVDGGRGESGRALYLLTEQGLFRSGDLGRSWQPLESVREAGLAGNDQPRLQAVAASRNHPETVYLSVGAYPVELNGQIQTKRGIMKSADGGQSWQWVLEVCGGEVLGDNFQGGWLLRTLGWLGNPSYLGVGPSNPEVCYGTDSGRTYRTLDGGKTWRQVVSRDLPEGGFTSRGLDVTTTYGVHFDPYDRDHFFITYTDIGLYHTYNGGKSWHASLAGIPRQWRNTCYWMEFDPAVKGRIWSVWSNVHDLPRPKMHRSGNLVNGNQQGGAAVSTDGGQWWELLQKGAMTKTDYADRQADYSGGMRLGAVPTHIVLDPDSPVDSRTLYVCDYTFGVWKSTDGGRTWAVKNQGLAADNLNCWRITRLPSGRLILLVARGGLEGQPQEPGRMYYFR